MKFDLEDFLASEEGRDFELRFESMVDYLIVNENMTRFDANIKVIKDVFGDIIPGKKMVIKQRTKNGFKIL